MIRFKIDSESTELLDKMTTAYKFKRDSITARIALAISIKRGKVFIENVENSSSNGREYTPTSNFFGRIVNDVDNYQIYKSILDQYYNKNLSEHDFIRLVKLHLKDGLMIWDNATNTSSRQNEYLKFLIKEIKDGLSMRSSIFRISSSNVKETHLNINQYSEAISFSIGKTVNGEIIQIDINDETKWSSRNIAIAGQNGSGKSQLVLDIIYQLSKNSNNQLPFTFFDFKGTDSEESLRPFLNATNCTFLKVEHDQGLPFSPLTRLDVNNPNNILGFVNDFQTFFPEIKQVQAASFIRKIQEYINDHNQAPKLVDLMESILEGNNEKDNTTTSVLQQLVSSGIYNEEKRYEIFNQSTYVSMPSNVSKQIKQFVIFNKLKYMFNNFKSVGNTSVSNNIKGLRHIIVVDEAQNFLQKKTARPIVEDMLRELRSIGVIVILIAQETSDFSYPDFDFISQVKLAICADVNDKGSRRMTKFIGSVNSEIALENEIKKYSRVETDEIGNPIKKAIININEPKSIEINQFWKSIRQVK